MTNFGKQVNCRRAFQNAEETKRRHENRDKMEIYENICRN